MVKKIICIIMALLIVISLSACVEVESVQQEKEKSMFIVIETSSSWKVVYHKETKVMYVISLGYYNVGTFTLMVDENGNPLLWRGEE